MSAAAPTPALLRVLGVAQSYEWGKLGAASAVGQLMAAAASSASQSNAPAAPAAGALAANAAAASSSSAFQLEEGKPYAELWMGTHSSGPSRVVQHPSGSVVPLKDHLGGAELPFLFKVLSVGKALSIQAHPNASLAKQLHAERPNIYKDGQHKPELACALYVSFLQRSSSNGRDSKARIVHTLALALSSFSVLIMLSFSSASGIPFFFLSVQHSL
jgi:mannose-6-phosphate isomerase